MSTSGNTSWELQSTALVTAAYRKLGYISLGQTLDATSLANGVEALNGVVAYLVTKGMPLWKRTTTVLTPSATSQVYTIADAVKLVQVVLKDSTGSQYPLVEKSLYDFNMLPSTAAAGVPVHYTFQPTITGGTLSIWPLTSDTATISRKTISAVYQKKFDGFFSATDTMDFPSYWSLAIIYSLAVILAPESGYPLQDRSALKAEATEYVKAANDYGDEDGSLFVQPDPMSRGSNSAVF
jgi:hypothetical protein